MFDCLVIGDSIGVGVGYYRPECKTIASIGITSGEYIVRLLPKTHYDVETVVISLGVNDGAIDTFDNLQKIRKELHTKKVIWLLPALREKIRAIILETARAYGDRVIDTRPNVARGLIHPSSTGYQAIANKTKS